MKIKIKVKDCYKKANEIHLIIEDILGEERHFTFPLDATRESIRRSIIDFYKGLRAKEDRVDTPFTPGEEVVVEVE